MTTNIDEISEIIERHLDKTAEDIINNIKHDGTTKPPSCVNESVGLVCTTSFWDKWSQKLLAQLISVKVWGLFIITFLIWFGMLTGAEYTVCFSLIIGAKGGKDIVMKLMESKDENDIIDRV